MTAPRLHVPPPTFTPAPYGLLSVVETRYDESDPHWRGGVQYQPLCGTAATTFDQCASVTGTGGPPPAPAGKTATATIRARGATPFTVYADIACSAVGFYDQAQALAGGALARYEPWQVERTFWTGLAGGQPVVYPHLAADAEFVDGVLLQTAATAVTGAVLDPVEALGRLEQALADCYVGVGVIHVPELLIPAFAAKGLVVKDGQQRLRTWNGNRVAAGAGYPGTSPAGAAPAAGTSWIYATGAVFAYRSAPMVLPNPTSVDRLTNTVTALVERTYVLGWDCCHFAALVSTGGDQAGVVNAPGPLP